jgi:polysaccharide deacetylase family protein (PEP-CTERM system associated)
VADARQPFLLTFDVEDWDQIVRRRVGDRAWPRGGPAFERQILAVLDLLADLGATATFFVLGMTAERHPDSVAAVAEQGHEIASHGYLHEPVYRQTRAGFRRDVTRSLDCIEQITGRRPTGYRAPWFSITRDTGWAYDELAALGVRFDSSRCAWPPHRARSLPAAERPYRLPLRSGGELWELPIPVFRAGPVPLPVAGGASWRLVPPPVLLRMLRRVRRTTCYPPLYFHPCELDPRPLRSAVPRSAGLLRKLGGLAWCAWGEVGRRRVVSTIRQVAVDSRLISCRDALGEMVAHELDPADADEGRVGQPIRPAGQPGDQAHRCEVSHQDGQSRSADDRGQAPRRGQDPRGQQEDGG